MIIYTVSLALFSLILISVIFIRYRRAVKEYLNSEASKGMSSADLLKEVLEMSSEEDKKQLFDMVLTDIPHAPGKTTAFINPLLVVDNINIFKFKLGQNLTHLFPYEDRIYTAELVDGGKYKVVWFKENNEDTQHYDIDDVINYIECGAWLKEGGE